MTERFFSASSASGCAVPALDVALLRLAGHLLAFLDLTKNPALLLRPSPKGFFAPPATINGHPL
jgi:hypothetical protein